MAGINDIASAVTSLMDFASTSSNMDEIDFDVTERPNGKTSYMRYEYVPEEDEILVRSGRRWGRIVPGGAVSNVLDIDLADIVDGTETEIELTGVDDDWIAAVTGSDYKGLVLTIDEEQVFVPFYNEAQATYMEVPEGEIGLGDCVPGEMQWTIYKDEGKWYIEGHVYQEPGGNSGDGAIITLETDLADIVNETATDIELTGVDDAWIAAVTGGDCVGLYLTIGEDQVFAPLYSDAQAEWEGITPGSITLGYPAPGEWQWEIYYSEFSEAWYITGNVYQDPSDQAPVI